MTIADLKNKRVGILGLGVNNKKLAEYLSKHSVVYEVIEDWKNPEELSERVQKFEILFRTPGLPYKSLPIQTALDKGVVVYSQTKLFFDLCPCSVIGVTGTKGKGTVASLIADILTEEGKRKTWLAGNIGSDPFQFIDQIKKEDLVVLELSSFQLQDLQKSPHIAVVTNISADHLDHHASMDEYLESKANILLHQTKEDFAVLNKSISESFAEQAIGQKIFFSTKDAQHYPVKILGMHNLENVAAAAAVAKLLDVSEQVIVAAVSKFENLPHHLQIVMEREGVTFVDDSASTNPDSTIAAIRAFDKDLVLVVGGVDKGLDYGDLAKEIKTSKHVKGLVVIGDLTQKIITLSQGFKGQVISGAKDMKEIIEQAMTMAESGDIVLFSPGAASFDMFENAKDRGEKFVNSIK